MFLFELLIAFFVLSFFAVPRRRPWAVEAAKDEENRPFRREQDNTQKPARLKEFDILLNMYENDREILGAAPDGGRRKPW